MSEHPHLFRVYQQLQSSSVSSIFKKVGHIISFLPRGKSAAIFAGVFAVEDFAVLDYNAFWSIPENEALGKLGYNGLDEGKTAEFFRLQDTDYLSEWKGRLIVGWKPGRNMVRLVQETSNPVEAILPESDFAASMPEWHELLLSWDDLDVLPRSWRMRLSQWRGVYYIFDVSLNKGYVGLAAGHENLAGRWSGYAASGHGGNQKLRASTPSNLRFSILQLVSPTLPREELEGIEAGWKRRLHTREPHGLNLN